MAAAGARDERKARALGRAEVMLALAEITGIDVDALAFVAARVEHHLSMLDSAEPARRRGLEQLAAEDFADLANTYKRLRRVVERGGVA